MVKDERHFCFEFHDSAISRRDLALLLLPTGDDDSLFLNRGKGNLEVEELFLFESVTAYS